ncbi:VRR-NUC domain-containing protein [Pseudoleptotrichia goodfellowii]|uniref:phosphodiesterase I n=1 Tax=Pseudoleptotrichia goodfellowii TaxID=157692 RepID=A0A510JB54_9FUSO|nr:VRR-NUC domain-containing protein [Pseudoleptotrichia goodfellowii]BBM35415.1 hypothetical protein JCM16774_0327 [Pseudoleptotrichia goodfellowii]
MVKIRNLELNIGKEIGYYLFENKKFKTIEEVVIQYYEDRGYRGIYTENKYWRNFFGLFFDNIIVEQVGNVNILKFDFQKEIDIKKVFNKTYFLNKAYCPYKKEDLKVLLDFLDLESFMKLLFYYRIKQSGFPDVMIYNKKELLFLEVKNKNDMLRESQAITLQVLSSNNVNVEICTINFSERKKKEIIRLLKSNKEDVDIINYLLQDIIKINRRNKYWYEKGLGILFILVFWYIGIPLAIISFLNNYYKDKAYEEIKVQEVLKKRKNKGS